MRILHVSALLTLAFTQISSLSTKSLEEPSSERSLRSGANCLASATVTCTTEDNKPCQEKTFLSSKETCGPMEVKLEYEYCNNNEKAKIDVKDNSYIAYKGTKKPIPEAGQSMEPGCNKITTNQTVSTCDRTTSFQILFEGDVEKKSLVEGYHCYEFQFGNLKFMTEAPSAAPVTPPDTDVPECNMEASIDCTFKNSGLACSSMDDFISNGECEDTPVIVKYKFCNNSTKKAILYQNLTVAKLQTVDQNFNNKVIGKEKCREFSRSGTFNCRTNKRFAMSLKVEGYMNNFEDRSYCFAWAFDEVKLPRPVTKLRTTCFINSVDGSVDKECKSMQAIENDSQCLRQLTYTYYITNTLSNNVKSKGVVVRIGGEDVEILEGSNSAIAKDGEVLIASHVVVKDLCEQPKGDVIKNNAVAVIANENGGVSSTKAFDYEFIPNFQQDDCDWMFDDDYGLQCSIQGMESQSCEQYINALTDANYCLVEVLFKFKVKNVGLACCRITDAESNLSEASGDDDIILHMDNSCQEGGLFCPGNDDNSWMLEQAKTIDLCQFTGATSEFKVGLNSQEKAIEFSFPAIKFELPLCERKPSQLKFRLVENSCDLATMFNVFSCTQAGCLDFDKAVLVTITDENGEGDYSPTYNRAYFGGVVVMEARPGSELPDNLIATIYQMNNSVEVPVQRLLIQSSCSQPILGEKHGVLEICGWVNDDDINDGDCEIMS